MTVTSRCLIPPRCGLVMVPGGPGWQKVLWSAPTLRQSDQV